MDIPLNAIVFCQDGRCGRLTNVVLNPTTERVTHLVIQQEERPHTEYLVPIDLLGETTPASVNLHCDLARLQACDPFTATEFVKISVPRFVSSYGWPVTEQEQRTIRITHHSIPLAELTVRQGTRVAALDGQIGKVDEFVSNEDGHITHLVIRADHGWSHEDIAIPVTAIAGYDDHQVNLNIDRAAVKKLPTRHLHH